MSSYLTGIAIFLNGTALVAFCDGDLITSHPHFFFCSILVGYFAGLVHSGLFRKKEQDNGNEDLFPPR